MTQQNEQLALSGQNPQQPVPRASALALMASRFSVEPTKLLETLKATCFKGATNEELLALVVVANAYGLNPLTKEIYAFPSKGGGIVPVVSVDGWIRMTNDHPMLDGIDFEDKHDGGKLISVTCIIHRKDRARPIRVTEYLDECKRDTQPWKMEHRMLRHKALTQCARVAFGFSGVHDEEEAGEVTITGPVRDIPKAQLADKAEKVAEATVIPPDKAKPLPKAEKKAKAEEKKPDPKPTPAAQTSTENEAPEAEQLAAKLQEGGFTVAEVLSMAKAMRLPGGADAVDIPTLGAENIHDILGDWKIAADHMTMARQ